MLPVTWHTGIWLSHYPDDHLREPMWKMFLGIAQKCALTNDIVATTGASGHTSDEETPLSVWRRKRNFCWCNSSRLADTKWHGHLRSVDGPSNEVEEHSIVHKAKRQRTGFWQDLHLLAGAIAAKSTAGGVGCQPCPGSVGRGICYTSGGRLVPAFRGPRSPVWSRFLTLHRGAQAQNSVGQVPVFHGPPMGSPGIDLGFWIWDLRSWNLALGAGNDLPLTGTCFLHQSVRLRRLPGTVSGRCAVLSYACRPPAELRCVPSERSRRYLAPGSAWPTPATPCLWLAADGGRLSGTWPRRRCDMPSCVVHGSFQVTCCGLNFEQISYVYPQHGCPLRTCCGLRPQPRVGQRQRGPPLRRSHR